MRLNIGLGQDDPATAIGEGNPSLVHQATDEPLSEDARISLHGLGDGEVAAAAHETADSQLLAPVPRESFRSASRRKTRAGLRSSCEGGRVSAVPTCSADLLLRTRSVLAAPATTSRSAGRSWGICRVPMHFVGYHS